MNPQRTGVAEIFRHAGASFRDRFAGCLNAGRRKVMAAIERCRTAALGGHLYQCERCAREHPVYNSCRNRHCPSCQGRAASRWMEARAADILPVPYFHVVFTLPSELTGIVACNRRPVFNIFFRAAAETLRTIAEDPRHGGMRIGGTAVLHTWDQRLRFHPHLHIVVPNAGFDVATGEWKTGSRTFLAPVKVLASLFRRRFLEQLARAREQGQLDFQASADPLADPAAFRATLAAARGTDWIVYAKKPFRGPESVFRYLSRYTHRIAISDRRILAFDGEQVTFRSRKPKRPGQRKPRYGTTTLTAHEFIRRFLLHVLPERLQRIRHFGILANGCRAKTLRSARDALGIHENAAQPDPETPHEGSDPDEQDTTLDTAVPCPHCGGKLQRIREIPSRTKHPSARDPPAADLSPDST